MAAQVGQQLLKVNQSLKKAYDQLALDTASSQTNQTTSTFNNSTEFTPSKFTQPSSFPHSSSPKTPKTPQFDLHAYIDSLESTNHSLKLDLDRTVSETMNKTRKINKLEKELILARDEMHQLQMDMEQDSRIKQRIDVKHAMGSMRDQTGILLDSLYAQVDALTREKKACEQSNRSLQEELHEIKIQVECLEQQEVQDKKSIFSKESELLSLRKLWKQQKRQLMQLRHELETERQDRLKASARIIDRVLGPCEEVSRVVDNPRSPSRWLSLRNASSEELIAQFWNPEAELLPKGMSHFDI